MYYLRQFSNQVGKRTRAHTDILTKGRRNTQTHTQTHSQNLSELDRAASNRIAKSVTANGLRAIDAVEDGIGKVTRL